MGLKFFRDTGRCAAMLRGGSISPLEKHSDFLLSLIARQPDLTLDEIVLIMRRHKINGSRTAVWRFFERHNVTVKKKRSCGRTRSPDVARARRHWKRAQPLLDSSRLVFIDETAAKLR